MKREERAAWKAIQVPEEEGSENVFKVPKKLWNKFTEHGRLVFNRMYVFSVNNPSIVWHDAEHPPSSPEDWKVVSWNYAVIAALEISKIQKGK